MHHSSTIGSFSRVVLALSLASVWVACAAMPARAGLVIGTAGITAIPGSSSNSFDVTLTNNGMTGVDIAAFSFEITTSSGYASFSDVTINTQSAPYIFAGNSLFGPDITLVATGNTVSAEDNYATPDQGVTLGSGQTLDLGHVVFALASGAPAVPIPLTFVGFPATGVNAPDGTQYSVTFGTVPEPASLLLGLQGLLLTCYIAFRAQRSASPRAR